MARVKFGEIVRDVKINVDRSNNPYEYYVAGDHMDSEDLNIHRVGRFSTDDVGPAFTRIFKPGQILYGSRRTYLKKVAVADFEGICANTTFVLESKNEEVFDSKLLPFLMLSDSFTKWSVSHSKGSTNPYVLFSDLALYEFDLPPLSEQKLLAEKLWAAYKVKQSYIKMIEATDEMVKSQFVEMFGRTELVPLSFYADSLLGGISLAGGTRNSHRVITTGAVTTDYFKETEYKFLPDDYIPNEAHLIKQGDVVVCRKNSLEFVGNAAYIDSISTELYLSDLTWKIVFNANAIPHFVWQALIMPNAKQQIHSLATGTCGSMRNITKPNLLKVLLPKATTQEQLRFVIIAEQADKSKFELRKSIEAIDKVIKSLINENL